MSIRLVAAVVTAGAFALAPLATAEPLPAACVVVTPVHAQVGYAPHGPSDCVVLV
jgi:hypothetical protein